MADLYGTYDKRIKITIDHTDIDSDLNWFPVTVFLTDSQGEGVFTEFDADEDFDRIAFTTDDEETQLYADCELFDDSEQKAIYHVSKTGWTVSSSVDTDIYLYYDNDAAHNTTYISKSGDTAAQSVYDGNFKAVYHMNDPVVDYDTEYDGSVEPDSDGWTLGGTDYASSDGDILTIDTSADDTYTCYYYKSPDIDFDGGFYLKLRVKADSIMSGDDHLRVDIQDGTQNERMVLHIFDGSARLWTDSGNTTKTFNNTDDYHTYEVYIKETTAYFYVDGEAEGTLAVWSNSVSDSIKFGDTTSSLKTKAYIDYLNYALDIGYNPTGIVDATSNHNDGDKKASGEPVEATGKVGQGQDFDGSDDNIGPLAKLMASPTEITIEGILKTDDTSAEYRGIAHNNEDPYVSFRLNAGGTANKIQVNLKHSEGEASPNTTSYTLTNYHYIATSGKENDYHKIYVDGTHIDADVEIGTFVAANTIGSYIGSHRGGSLNFFKGIIDEVRFSDVARTAAWIAATYDSLWDGLNTYGDEETAPTGTTTNPLFMFANFITGIAWKF